MNWFILAVISAVFSAAAAVSQKKVLFKLEGIDFSFLVSIVSLILCIPFFITMDYGSLQGINLFILFLKTIPGTAAFLFVMLSIKNMEISKALPLLALTPGFVAIFAFLILGDMLTPLQSSGIVLLFIGTYLIETKSGQSILDPFRSFFMSGAYRFVIAALLLFTITSIADRYLLGRYKLMPSQFMAFQQLFFSVNFLAALFLFKKNPVVVVRSVDRKI
ncbi:MAG: EamA family transporter, partial [Syntrophothermus sp.]